ncbi:MAG: ribose 5-phosphate isomerase B [Candidatus Kapabacteria bacterium]|nr:ribose 5-phosphate isomerase B [Candidatus Kapabacteria bacterium]
MKEKIAVASDHAGYDLKQELIKFLEIEGYKVDDFGTNDKSSCDYPDFAFKASKSVAEKLNDFGILICGTGIGMSIVANKVKGIRAANCCSVDMAKLSREHNDANILTLGARLLNLEEAKSIVVAFLNSKFEGDRHLRRINKINELTGL